MAYQFKIQIENIKEPSVWRNVVVAENSTFHQFHLVIQGAFGWENYHLYNFSPSGYGSRPVFSLPDIEADDFEGEDSALVKLSDFFKQPKDKLVYIYDFGDDWRHQVVLEAILDEKIIPPTCTAGKGTCPPEDCGGPWGYTHLLQVLANPEDPEYDEMREWLGLEVDEEWDVNGFDVDEANEMIRARAD